MIELLVGAVSGVAVAAATVLVAWMNSRSAARQSSIGTYEQLVNQVTAQQDRMAKQEDQIAKQRKQIDELHDQMTALKLEMFELRAANARWAKWAESLVVDWPERRQRHDPPELPQL